jgi:hypothetical protein
MDGLYFGFIVCEYFETMLTIDLYLLEASLVAKSVSESNWSLDPDFKVLIWCMKLRSQCISSPGPAEDDGAMSCSRRSVILCVCVSRV